MFEDERSMRARADAWVNRRRHLVLGLLVVSAVVLRGVLWVQVSSSPLATTERIYQDDMHSFDVWAQAIADGDWLSAHIEISLVTTVVEAATKYLAAHPGDPAWAVASGDGDAARAARIRSLWNRWHGPPRLYQDALYPYLIAATYLVVGPSKLAVRGWQNAAGVLTVLLLFGIGRRAFGAATGALTATIAVFYAPFFFFENQLLRVTTILLSGALFTWLLLVAHDRRDQVRWWAFAGAVGGASYLLKSSFVLMLAGAAVTPLALYGWRDGLARRKAMVFVAAALPLIAVLAIRNLSLGLPLLDSASSGPLAFVVANARDASPGNFGAEHLAQIFAETEAKMGATMRATLATHSPGSFLNLIWTKFLYATASFELGNNTDWRFITTWAPITEQLPARFPLVFGLGVTGVVLSARRWRELLPLHIILLPNFALTLLFFVYSRHRVPYVAALFPFAAWAVIWLADQASRRAWRNLGAGLAATLLLALWTMRDMTPEGVPEGRHADWVWAYQYHWTPAADARLVLGDKVGAADAFRRSFERVNPLIDEVDRGVPRALSVLERDILRFYGEMYGLQAQLERDAGRSVAADAMRVRSAHMHRLAGPKAAASP